MKKLFLLIILCSSFFSACNLNSIYEKNVDIPDYIWNYDFKVPFEVEISDTAVLYNVYANIRHTDAYPFRNLWIIIHTTLPSGEQKEKRIELQLADEAGKYFGEGMGDIWDYETKIQENAIFPQVGKYKFEFEQSMRQNPLPMVMSMGLKIERIDKKR